MRFSSLKSGHLIGIINTSRQKDAHRQKHEAKTTSLPCPKAPPRKKKDKITAAFHSDIFSPFPPGSKCLFSSLVVLCLDFAGVAAVPARVLTCSVGEEMSRPWFDPMPTSKIVVGDDRSCSHAPSF